MKQKIIFVFLILFTCCSVLNGETYLDDVNVLWNEHKETFRLSFDRPTDLERFKIFKENYRKINEHNKANKNLVLGMNQFGHLTEKEFKEFLMRSYKGNKNLTGIEMHESGSATIADIDWRKKGLVTEIKNQGFCGSCWAFSATGALEGQYAKNKGHLVELSEQDLVDCSRSYGNEGCSGGLMSSSFAYVRDHGINPEKLYPYTGKERPCKHDKKAEILYVKDFVNLPSGNEDILSNAVAEVGPISVAIDASPFSFQFYRSGVYWSNYCSSTNLNHGVLVVGIGSSPSPHYIIKNSWSTWWGSSGYMLLARNVKNMCGVATDACYPTLKP